MPIAQIHTEDGPIRFRSEIYDDSGPMVVTAADAMQYRFKKPDGTVEVKTGSGVASLPTYIEYTTPSGYFRGQVGIWQYQAQITVSGGVYYGEADDSSFPVKSILE